MATNTEVKSKTSSRYESHAAALKVFGRVELLGDADEILQSWRIDSQTCAIGSDERSLVRIDGLAAKQLSIVFGRRNTLLKSSQGTFTVGQRTVKEWLIDSPTIIQLPGFRFQIHPTAFVREAPVRIDRSASSSGSQTSPESAESVEASEVSDSTPKQVREKPSFDQKQLQDIIVASTVTAITKSLEPLQDSLKSIAQKWESMPTLADTTTTTREIEQRFELIERQLPLLSSEVEQLNHRVNDVFQHNEAAISSVATEIRSQFESIANKFDQASSTRESNIEQSLSILAAQLESIQSKLATAPANESSTSASSEPMEAARGNWDYTQESYPTHSSSSHSIAYQNNFPIEHYEPLQVVEEESIDVPSYVADEASQASTLYEEEQVLPDWYTGGERNTVAEELLETSGEVNDDTDSDYSYETRDFPLSRLSEVVESEAITAEDYAEPSVEEYYEEEQSPQLYHDRWENASDISAKHAAESSHEDSEVAHESYDALQARYSEPMADASSSLQQESYFDDQEQLATDDSSGIDTRTNYERAIAFLQDGTKEDDSQAYDLPNAHDSGEDITPSESEPSHAKLPTWFTADESSQGMGSRHEETLESGNYADEDQPEHFQHPSAVYTPARYGTQNVSNEDDDLAGYDYSSQQVLPEPDAYRNEDDAADLSDDDVSPILNRSTESQSGFRTSLDSSERNSARYEPILNRNAESDVSEVSELDELISRDSTSQQTSMSSTVEESSAQSEEEESVEDYMKRLLARVKGDDNVAPAPPLMRNSASTPTPKPRESVSLPKQEKVKPIPPIVEEEHLGSGSMTSEEYIPRSAAPEHAIDLELMRELANQTARTAIAKSDKRKPVPRNSPFKKLAISAFGFLLGTAFLLVNGLTMNFALLGAVCGYLIFLIWGYEASQMASLPTKRS